MKLGDLVRFEDQYWVVRRYDPKRTRTALLLDKDGRTREIPFDHPVQVIVNPGEAWPFITVKDNPAGQRIEGIARAVDMEPVPLRLYEDWVPSDPARPGGPIFLNPAMGLRTAETLIVTWRRGRSSTVTVPAGLATVGARVARAEAARVRPEQETSYNALLMDALGDDET